MRLDRNTLSNTLWVTKTTVKRSSCHSSSRSSLSLKRVISSSAANGSSINSTRGLVTSPRAIETRIFMPPESSRGTAFSKPVEVHALQHLADRRRRLGARHALQPERQPDIVEDAGPGQQRRLLEHEADVGAAEEAAPRQSSMPEVGVDRPAISLQRRRLAAAGRPEQAEEIAFAGSSGRRRSSAVTPLENVLPTSRSASRVCPTFARSPPASARLRLSAALRRLTSSGRGRRPC